MTYHAHVDRAQPQLGADLVGAALRIKRQDHDAALPLGETLEATGHAIEIEGRRVADGRRRQIRAEAFQKPLPTSHSTPQVRDDPAAGPENEGPEMLRLAHFARTQALEGHEDDVLGQVVRGRRVAEVAKAVEANPGREAPVQLRFGSAVPPGDSARQLGVARIPDVIGFSQGADSIPQAYLSNGKCNGEPGRYTSPARRRTDDHES